MREAKSSTSIAARRTLDLVARRTGQIWKLNLARLILLSACVVLAVSAYRRVQEHDALSALWGWCLFLLGTLVGWFSVKCPSGRTPIEWHRLKTRSIFSKAAWSEHDGDCLHCGYRRSS